MPDDRNRTPQPLVDNQPIVNPNGTPTQYFIRWAQERQIAIEDGVTPEQVQQFIDDWAAARAINVIAPIIGGGTLDADITIEHAPSGVTADTYGDSTHVPQITVDEFGHVTDVVEVAISGGGGGGGAPFWASAFGGLDVVGSATATATGSHSGNPQSSMEYLFHDDFYWNNGETAAKVVFDFLTPQVISGIAFIQDRTSASQGMFQAAGSNDNVIYTNLGAPGAWGGGLATNVYFSNSTPYRYYRVSQVSGSTNSSPYQRQFLFRWGAA